MSWQKVVLGKFLKNREGRYKPNDQAILGLKRIDKINFSGTIFLSDKPSNTDMILVKKGDLVISGINVEKGAMNIYKGDEDVVATIHYSSYIFDEKQIDIEFLTSFLKSLEFKKALREQVPGGIKTEIKPKHILPLVVEMPIDVNDQRTIVKKLAESNSVIKNVELEINSQLNLLKQLRQSFLREAMQGKLLNIKYIEGHETGQQLLDKIKVEKARLIAEKKFKQGKLQEAEVLENLLFEIPQHWIWCNLDEICYNITDGTHQTPQYTSSGKMFLSAQNVKPFKFMPEKHKFVSEQDYQNYIKNRKPEKGDLLIGRVGAGIGETAVIDQDIDFCIYVSVALIQPFKEYINSDYMALVFNSPYGVRYAKGNISSRGSAGNFNLGRIRSFQIPLPPLKEQQLIVAKLDQLMAFCDSLEQSIKESQDYNDLLLQQVLREALQPKEEAVLNIDSLFEDDKDYNLHVAMIQTLIESELGINHGEVANQKTIFHINTFTNEKIPYQFINYHFGTFSQQLRDDFNKNPYLTKTSKNNKDVFIVKPSKQKEVLDNIYKPENKNFVNAVKEILDIYQLPSINKETDKIELLNTVSKVIQDHQSIDIEVVYQGMKDWKINQGDYKCKADKFSKPQVSKMIKLIQNKGLEIKLLSKE